MPSHTTHEPLVSVVMPVHDAERYLDESIGSVLAQDMDDLELVAVDDASNDGSLKLLHRDAALDERVRVIALADNCGAARARNLALQEARGRYVAFLDSDDWWQPQKLSLQLSLMEATGFSMCTCGYLMHFEDAGDERQDRVFHVPERVTYEDLLRVNYFSCSTLVVERRLVPKDMFDPSLQHEDYGAWLALTKGGQVACGIDEPLATYRVRGGSRSNDKLAAALGRWNALRECTDEPLPRRVGIIVDYAVAGLKKYSRRSSG